MLYNPIYKAIENFGSITMVTTKKNFTDVLSWLNFQKRNFGHAQIRMFIKAIRLANTMYKGQAFKPTTVSVMEHALQCASKVADLELQFDAVVATILYSVPKFCKNWKEELAPFGNSVIELVDGITKVGNIRRVSHDIFTGENTNEQQIEVVRTMLLAMVTDIRAVIIVLIGRGELMLNLNTCNNPDKVLEIAQTTMSIFAPLANRLGLWQIKWELEDISFKYLHFEEYKKIAKLLDSTRNTRLTYINNIKENLAIQISNTGIKNFQIHGRAKHIYSIWNKMQNKNYSFEDLYDILAMRIIVSTIPECYAVLGIIHTHYLPITGEFSDYIASPKSNHYQSLHTCVKTDNNLSVEVQIRTLDMHEHAEYGIAAHWRYKEGGMGNPEFEEKIAWIRRILDLEKNDQLSSQQLSKIFKNEVFADKIYVITPKGQVINLPKGATVIDFAYQIHNDIGNRCKGAKLDNKIVPISTALKNGQMVEVLCNKESSPNMNWIYNKWVTTTKAKNAIKRYFRELSNKSYSLTDTSEEKNKLIISTSNKEELINKISFNRSNIKNIKQPNIIEISGYKDIMHHIAKCCTPIPNDEIIGFVTQGRGIAVHRKNCTNLFNLIQKSPNKFIEISWKLQENIYSNKFNLDFSIVAIDREKLLKDITEVCVNEKLNITNLVTNCKNDKAYIKFTVQILYTKDTQDIVNRLIAKIKLISGIIQVNRN